MHAALCLLSRRSLAPSCLLPGCASLCLCACRFVRVAVDHRRLACQSPSVPSVQSSQPSSSSSLTSGRALCALHITAITAALALPRPHAQSLQPAALSPGSRRQNADVEPSNQPPLRPHPLASDAAPDRRQRSPRSVNAITCRPWSRPAARSCTQAPGVAAAAVSPPVNASTETPARLAKVVGHFPRCTLSSIVHAVHAPHNSHSQTLADL